MKNAIKPGLYQNYHGNMYEVLYSHAAHSGTQEKMVVYKAHHGSGQVWIRPLSFFMGAVILYGNTVPRFKFVEWT